MADTCEVDAQIAGAADETYTTPALALTDNGAQYRVVVTNAHGTATSDPATVTMTTAQPPTVTITSPLVTDLWQGGQTISVSGFEPQVSLEAGTARVYDWYRERVFDGDGISAR